MNEGCRNRAVNAAAHCAKYFFACGFFADKPYLLFRKVVHRPVALYFANLIKEVAQNIVAVSRVNDFRVKLYSVNFSFVVSERRKFTSRRVGDRIKSFGRNVYFASMAHPAKILFGDTLE